MLKFFQLKCKLESSSIWNLTIVIFKLFCSLIKAGDSKHLRDKLSEGIVLDLNTICTVKVKGNKYPLLMRAAKGGQLDCVKVLLEFCALVDLPQTDDYDEASLNRSNAKYLACEMDLLI